MESIGKYLKELIDEDIEKVNKCDNCKQDIYLINGEECGCICDILEKSKKEINQSKSRAFDEKSFISQSCRQKRLKDIKQLTKEHQRAVEIAKDYVLDFEEKLKIGKSIMLQGDIGTGKTHIASAIRNELVKRGYKIFFVTLPEYLNEIKKGFNDSYVDSYVVERMSKESDLLIIDDIGANRMTDFAIEELFKLVDSRVGKCTIYTTNLTSRELRKNLDLQRVFSRMLENTEIITLKGEDYRMGAFK